MKFRPCIDLHNGQVKQIVGSTLEDDHQDALTTNFVADQPPSYFAEMYQADGLFGGHVIKLGPGNDDAAREALAAFPGGLQIGGGITAENAGYWLDQGAAAVIVTSYVFQHGQIHQERLQRLVQAVGKKHLVLDLSCRRLGDAYYIVTDRWQKFTDVTVSPKTLDFFASCCQEFLVHAVDVEGQCRGIEHDLAVLLGKYTPLPTTYAGGIKNIADLQLLQNLGAGHLDATIGSALDIFGGTGITYADAVAFHRNLHP